MVKYLFKPDYSRWELFTYGIAIALMTAGDWFSTVIMVLISIIVQFYVGRSISDD